MWERDKRANIVILECFNCGWEGSELVKWEMWESGERVRWEVIQG